MNHGGKKLWTDKIPNHVLCDYFYIFFMIFSVFAAISFIGGVYIFTTSKMPIAYLIGLMFNILLSFGISATGALFLYLICDRALAKDGFDGSAFEDAFYDKPKDPQK